MTPDVGLTEAYVKFAPPGTEIAGKSVTGFEFGLGFDLLGARVEGNAALKLTKAGIPYKVDAQLFMHEVDLGLIKIGGKGGPFTNEEGKEITKKGAIVSLSFNPLSSEILDM